MHCLAEKCMHYGTCASDVLYAAGMLVPVINNQFRGIRFIKKDPLFFSESTKSVKRRKKTKKHSNKINIYLTMLVRKLKIEKRFMSTFKGIWI